MEQTNATVDCDVTRLDLPLRPFKARQGHGFVALFRRVPADAENLYLRVFRENGAYFDITAHEHRGGEWTARVPAACFPSAGDFAYEVHATAADGQPCALGAGEVHVEPFSTTSSPAAVGEVQTVAQLPCEGGGFVDVVMKWDGYEWMPAAVKSATATDATEDSE